MLGLMSSHATSSPMLLEKRFGPTPQISIPAILSKLLRRENERRAAEILRYRAVAEANHHIRNALQVLAFYAPSAEHREIGDAVQRIELTLSEVLPKVLTKG